MIIKLYHLNQNQKNYLYSLEKTRGDDVILLETRLSPTDSQFDLLISFSADPEVFGCEIVDTLMGYTTPEDAEKLLSPNMKVNEGKLFTLVEEQRSAIHKAVRGE